MNGKMNNKDVTLLDLFEKQVANQKFLMKSGSYNDFGGNENLSIPADNPKLSTYHIQQLISEIGEVLSADKRWKNFRNDKNDTKNKYEEIADCFIVLLNIAMYSGMDAELLAEEITDKIEVFRERIIKENEKEK